MIERLLKVEEAAELVGMSKAALYEAARRNQIPSVRIGSRVRFPVSLLNKWIEQQASQSFAQKSETAEHVTSLAATA